MCRSERAFEFSDAVAHCDPTAVDHFGKSRLFLHAEAGLCHEQHHVAPARSIGPFLLALAFSEMSPGSSTALGTVGVSNVRGAVSNDDGISSKTSSCAFRKSSGRPTSSQNPRCRKV